MVDLEFEDEDYNAIPPLSLSADPDGSSAQTLLLEMPAALAGQRLDQALAGLLPDHSRTRLAALIRDNAVSVDGMPQSVRYKVVAGQKVAVTLTPRAEDLAYAPEALDLAILHEDADVMVLDKPAGLVVHPAAGNWTGTLLNGLLHHAPRLARVPRAGIVHRLDKDTSGLMVVAMNEAAQFDLVRQLQARTVKREYLALAQGSVRVDGTVDAPIGRHPKVRTRMAVVANGKPAVTHYRVLERMALHTLVECRLETGRTHQIRVHMQSIGHPLEGDTVYGARTLASGAALKDAVAAFARQALHAQRLAFEHPATKRAVNFESPVPADLQTLVAAARKAGA